jgi:hydroxymethylpyrimidine kinase/phosphomethylpyrimidine kinase
MAGELTTALTIAGSDSSGGAGIQADLKTFTALKVYGMSAITAVTSQNTLGVSAVRVLPPETVATQIDAVFNDISVNAVKSGMLASAAIIEVVADRLQEYEPGYYVLDPVMVSESGQSLLDEDAIDTIKSKLFPLALVVTPNKSEAEVFSGKTIETVADMEEAARAIYDFGPAYVLVKGGHVGGSEATDVLFDGIKCYPFTSPRVKTKHTHGTGCTFASAMTAFLAKGFELSEAIPKAKFYLHNALQQGLDIGKGPGPVNHVWNVDD